MTASAVSAVTVAKGAKIGLLCGGIAVNPSTVAAISGVPEDGLFPGPRSLDADCMLTHAAAPSTSMTIPAPIAPRWLKNRRELPTETRFRRARAPVLVKDSFLPGEESAPLVPKNSLAAE